MRIGMEHMRIKVLKGGGALSHFSFSVCVTNENRHRHCIPQRMRIGNMIGVTSVLPCISLNCIGRFVNPTRPSKGIRDTESWRVHVSDEDAHAQSEQRYTRLLQKYIDTKQVCIDGTTKMYPTKPRMLRASKGIPDGETSTHKCTRMYSTKTRML